MELPDHAKAVTDQEVRSALQDAISTEVLKRSSGSALEDTCMQAAAHVRNKPSISWSLDVLGLLKTKPLFGSILLSAPTVLNDIVQQEIAAAVAKRSGEGANNTRTESWRVASVEKNARLELHNFPLMRPLTRSAVSEIRSLDVGKAVLLRGIVVRCGLVKMLDEKRQYRCAKCGEMFWARACPELFYLIDMPAVCPKGAYGEKSGKRFFDKKTKRQREAKCGGREFEAVEGCTSRTDYLELRLQELEHQQSGAVNRAVPVVLLGDLVRRLDVQAGDRLSVVGIVRMRWRALRREQRSNGGEKRRGRECGELFVVSFAASLVRCLDAGSRSELEIFVEASNVATDAAPERSVTALAAAAALSSSHAFSSSSICVKKVKEESQAGWEVPTRMLKAEEGTVRTDRASQGEGVETESLPELFLDFWKAHRHDPFKGRAKILEAVAPHLS
eukprot:Cvel_23237.t1-p1 / transcript=Cvel_23237.t1 / gene=Cvel_23237 / organism=Chromera_velia_CCMP2878 / gene_product=hypothetical protein / transcript_product=hypothetical protein / location=Cvel_scaffold2372:26130-28622(+) / protein_length=445 / sequence_SO=supercontig / SO=protein_coding / is_pseudo=false